jgi:mannose-6-phosphate isomerase-like protein (cupin superfamily)
MTDVPIAHARATVRRLDETAPVPCPCGSAYRVLTGADGAPASLHFVDVKTDSEVHYHRTFTEIYTCLEGSGALELDGERIPLTPGTVVAIPPGVRHRPIPGPAGTLRIINVAVPPFAPGDECLD